MYFHDAGSSQASRKKEEGQEMAMLWNVMSLYCGYKIHMYEWLSKQPDAVDPILAFE